MGFKVLDLLGELRHDPEVPGVSLLVASVSLGLAPDGQAQGVRLLLGDGRPGGQSCVLGYEPHTEHREESQKAPEE